MKKLIIIILVLVALGLYFYPGITRELIQNTANVIADLARITGNFVKDTILT